MRSTSFVDLRSFCNSWALQGLVIRRSSLVFAGSFLGVLAIHPWISCMGRSFRWTFSFAPMGLNFHPRTIGLMPGRHQPGRSWSQDLEHPELNSITSFTTRKTFRSNSSSLAFQYGCDISRMVVVQCDLSDFSSVRRAVDEFSKGTAAFADLDLAPNDLAEPKLDILVNNAGILSHSKFEKTSDGYEYVFQSNYLGTLPVLQG